MWGLLSGAEEWGSNSGVWQALHLPERRLSFGASPCESFHRPLGLCCAALLQPGCQKENSCALDGVTGCICTWCTFSATQLWSQAAASGIEPLPEYSVACLLSDL